MSLLSELITKLEAMFQHGNPEVLVDGQKIVDVAHNAETGAVHLVTKAAPVVEKAAAAAESTAAAAVDTVEKEV